MADVREGSPCLAKFKKKKKEDILLSKEGGVVPSGVVGVVGVGVVGVAAMSISGWLCGDSLHIRQVMSGEEEEDYLPLGGQTVHSSGLLIYLQI